MTTEATERDPVELVEELLAKAMLPGNFAAEAEGLLRDLVKEVKAHREHLEFCFHNHVMESELNKIQQQLAEVKNAATNTLAYLDAEAGRLRCATHDQPTHCVDCALRVKVTAFAKRIRETTKGAA